MLVLLLPYYCLKKVVDEKLGVKGGSSESPGRKQGHKRNKLKGSVVKVEKVTANNKTLFFVVRPLLLLQIIAN